MVEVPGSADYHDAHLNDPDEWEPAEQEAQVRPSGMTVFSLRLPNAELDNFRKVAHERGISVGELLRAAARAYLIPMQIYGQTGNLGATQYSQAADFPSATFHPVSRRSESGRPRVVNSSEFPALRA